MNFITEREIINYIHPNNSIKINYLWNPEDCPKSDIANNIIYIFPLNNNLTEEEIILNRSYIEHETAHILLTDMKEESNVEEKNYLINMIEDLRVNKYVSSLNKIFAEDIKFHSFYIYENFPEVFPYEKINYKIETIFALMLQGSCFHYKWKLSDKANKLYNHIFPLFEKWKDIDYKTKKGFSDVESLSEEIFQCF